LLARIGIVDHAFLVRHRRMAYLLIVILVVLLPPTDGLSDVIMSIPLVFLYEIAVWLNRSKVLIT
jgi:sec-independent protein translocase protein TatC